jgi:viroplasmin and RNaseH domain-containing protein
MPRYVVHVGQEPGIHLTWEDCYAQVNCYLGSLHKKYNTEVEALRAYYGARSANHGH